MQYKLTEYSHGAGCGCKLSPGVLADILGYQNGVPRFEQLLVGHDTKDDAAVVDLDGRTAIVSTTDFFMPIVNDPHDFGAIAATNAISDIYAMGATPIVAIAILGWPIEKIPSAIAAKVLEGGRTVCTRAGIPLAGGHSIDTPEPIFGLAVTGKVLISDIKRNNQARPGDLLYLTKPLGIGVVTTAQKRGLANARDLEVARASMLMLNDIGRALSRMDSVHAITDVTGFGLGGHLLEICDASGLNASIRFDQIPLFDFTQKYIALDCLPGGTKRNWQTFKHRLRLRQKAWWKVLADPQTSGGLLISVDPADQQAFEAFMRTRGYSVNPIGLLMEKQDNPDSMLFVE